MLKISYWTEVRPVVRVAKGTGFALGPPRIYFGVHFGVNCRPAPDPTTTDT